MNKSKLDTPLPASRRTISKLHGSPDVGLRTTKRVVTSSYLIYLGGRRYRLVGDDVGPNLFYQEVEIEFGPGDTLQVSYRGKQLQIVECGKRKRPNGSTTRKASNAGGRSSWMRTFFERSGPPVWKTIEENAERKISLF
jgi:hypothetical protein